MLLDPPQPPHPSNVKWRAVATGDFDNDGNTDILFQRKEKDGNGNEIPGGALMRWFMMDWDGYGIKVREAIPEDEPPAGNVVGPR